MQHFYHGTSAEIKKKKKKNTAGNFLNLIFLPAAVSTLTFSRVFLNVYEETTHDAFPQHRKVKGSFQEMYSSQYDGFVNTMGKSLREGEGCTYCESQQNSDSSCSPCKPLAELLN
jgi:hypothetical protein